MSAVQTVRDRINDTLIRALEKNLLPWRRPWSSAGSAGRHRNAATDRAYSGVNPLLLELHCLDHALGANRWATFNQWADLGCAVRRRPAHVPPGRWGCTVVFCKPVNKAVVDRDTGETEKERFLVLKTFTLFNADQVDGPAAERLRSSVPPVEPGAAVPAADELIAATGADIRFGGDRAFYRRPTPAGAWPHHAEGDFIVLPERGRFTSAPEYYKTALHELGHWSEVRLGWDHEKHGYAAGELVAELAGCYTATEVGVPLADLDNHAAYLKSWLAAIRESPGFIFRITSQAARVTDFLLSFVQPAGVAAEDSEAPAAR
jgi:antirestriction protein ArdC